MSKVFTWSWLMLLFGFSQNLLAQDQFLGLWKTIDDKTGEAKSHVEIYLKQDRIYGKIVKVLRPDAAELCDQCPGDKKNTPLVGLVIMEDLQAHDDYYRKGTILDPESGNEYGCSIWFEEDHPKDELKVRGKHWTGIYRTQTWYKVK